MRSSFLNVHWNRLGRIIARYWLPVVLLIGGFTLAACAGTAGPEGTAPSNPALGEHAQTIESLEAVELEADGPLKVLATTTLVADIAGRVGGDHIELTTLLPFGADPHGYSAAPQDVRMAIEADVILSNGFDLEASLLSNLAEAAPDTPIVSLSEGIEALELGHDLEGHEHEDEAGEAEEDHADDHEDEAAEAEEDHADAHEGGLDPHVWFDPLRVDYWAANAARAFVQLDPQNEASYQANSSELRQELVELHSWIYRETQKVPPENRELVTDHVALTYFADRYDFETVGAVIPAYSSAAEASAQELAELQGIIEERQVLAIFISAGANPELSQQLAADVGVPVVKLYAGSLTPPEGEAPDYFAFMRYNVEAIVDGLSP